MNLMVPSLLHHTNAVIARLETRDLVVGDAKAPDVDPPYVVVYPLAGGVATGTLGEIHADAELPYQVTCVGLSRKQVEWLVDETRVLLDGLQVAGRHIPLVRLEDGNPGVQRDDDATPPVFWSAVHYRVFTTPGEDES